MRAGSNQHPSWEQAQLSSLTRITYEGAGLNQGPLGDWAQDSDLRRSRPELVTFTGPGPNDLWDYRVTSGSMA